MKAESHLVMDTLSVAAKYAGDAESNVFFLSTSSAHLNDLLSASGSFYFVT